MSKSSGSTSATLPVQSNQRRLQAMATSKGTPTLAGSPQQPAKIIDNKPQKTVAAALASGKKQVDMAAGK
jgi:hypothetical protein